MVTVKKHPVPDRVKLSCEAIT